MRVAARQYSAMQAVVPMYRTLQMTRCRSSSRATYSV